MDVAVDTLNRAFAYSTPLLWAGLGAVYSERAGVVNLGVEGTMILGSLTAFAVAHRTGSLFLAVTAAALTGALVALVHAFISVTLRANQYVAGLAMTSFGLGLSGMLGRAYEGIALARPMQGITVPVLSSLPLVGPSLFRGQAILTHLGLLVAVALWVLLYKTRWGIAVRSVGESPATADAAGIRVARIRYASVIAGGALAGIGGAYLSVAYRPSWTEGMTAGMGWIAVAIAIFASWNPLKAVGASLFFGALYYLSFRLQAYVAPELLKLLPYLAVILVLAFSARGRRRLFLGAPEALGEPYYRGAR